ncbi:MAG TPA: hypothetical protein VFK44_03005 [Bacillales bacterium]|nr:hypothetical protein [Bacillales bacterium]
MKQRFVWSALILAGLVLVLAACGSQGTSNGQSDTYDVTLQLLHNDEIGDYLADGKGMTLYYFTKDEPGESYCKDQCLEAWPPLYGSHPKVPEGFKASDFGTITREDTGKEQITYKGYPLYYFTPDKKKGDVKGQGVKGVWYIVNAETEFSAKEGMDY